MTTEPIIGLLIPAKVDQIANVNAYTYVQYNLLFSE